MDKQQIFATVVAHLRQQNQRCKNANRCLYRGNGNLKCGIGCLITDQEFRPWMEGMDIGMVLDDYRCPQTLISRLDPQNNGELLWHLQNLHDDYEVSDWELGFENLAAHHKLEYKAP